MPNFAYINKSYVNFTNTLKNKSKSILFVCHSSSHVKIINSVFPNSKVMEFKHIAPSFKDVKIKKKKPYKNDFLFGFYKIHSK